MQDPQSTTNNVLKVTAALIVILALVFTPAPLFPPHFLSEKIQAFSGLQWKLAYLAAAVGLKLVFYFSIGLLFAFTVNPSASRRKRIAQIIFLPVMLVVAALLIRSLKTGNFPVWINAVIPIGACIVGAWLGLGLLYKRGILTFVLVVVLLGTTFWALKGTMTNGLTIATENQLRQLTTVKKNFPPEEEKFGALLQKAFELAPGKYPQSAVQQNRAAILALGIAIGDERLARFVNLDEQKELLDQAVLLRQGTTIRDRNDWTRHFCLSAALAVLENNLVSDASGLLKEQMDALTGGSGFSFTDIAADRAGVRFALAATNSEEDAIAMQKLLMGEYHVNNFLPDITDLPEGLTTEQFREKYGKMGSELYREQVSVIETRLDSCLALSPLQPGK